MTLMIIPVWLLIEQGHICGFCEWPREEGEWGFKYKSKEPYSNRLTLIRFQKKKGTYPQPKYVADKGFLIITKYTGIPELYFETSGDGLNWYF